MVLAGKRLRRGGPTENSDQPVRCPNILVNSDSQGPESLARWSRNRKPTSRALSKTRSLFLGRRSADLSFISAT